MQLVQTVPHDPPVRYTGQRCHRMPGGSHFWIKTEPPMSIARHHPAFMESGDTWDECVSCGVWAPYHPQLPANLFDLV